MKMLHMIIEAEDLACPFTTKKRATQYKKFVGDGQQIIKIIM